jgi:hypothetical protein
VRITVVIALIDLFLGEEFFEFFVEDVRPAVGVYLPCLW